MTNETPAAVGYTLWAVFARPVGARGIPAPIGAVARHRAIDALAASRPGRDPARLLRRVGPARRRRPHDLAARRRRPRRLQCGPARRSAAPRLLAPLLPRWNAMGVHRDAEFTATTCPAFMRGVRAEAAG